MQHLNEGRTNDDLLYEILLKLRLDLCVPVQTRQVAGKTVHNIGCGVLMACLDKHIAVAEASTAVFRDSAFENDVAKSNLAAIFEQHGIKQVRSL